MSFFFSNTAIKYFMSNTSVLIFICIWTISPLSSLPYFLECGQTLRHFPFNFKHEAPLKIKPSYGGTGPCLPFCHFSPVSALSCGHHTQVLHCLINYKCFKAELFNCHSIKVIQPSVWVQFILNMSVLTFHIGTKLCERNFFNHST